MSEITLEKIDILRERSNVSYTEAKEALESCDGNVVDALVYIEQDHKSHKESLYTTKDEFIKWLKGIINKGNVTRIKIKRDGKVVVDVPLNGGIAATTLAGILWAPILGIGFLTAVVTKVTVEIVKDDGSVEVVNKMVKNSLQNVKEKVSDAAENIKEKFNGKKESETQDDDNVYKYTVKFDEKDDDKKDDE